MHLEHKVRLSSRVHCLELHPLLPEDLKLKEKKYKKSKEKGKTICQNHTDQNRNADIERY